MSLGKPNNNESNWISFSDIMTGLMVIFMFIAISYIAESDKQQKEKDEIITSLKNSQKNLFKELESTFTTGKFKGYSLKVKPDLSIQITDENALFNSQYYHDDVVLKPEFQEFLESFTPEFYKIILKEDYVDNIAEIRIEGHTGIETPEKEDINDYYQKMLILSQKRSNKVLDFMMTQPSYSELSKEKKYLLKFITTSNGLAYGKALDSEGEYKYLSKNSISPDKSMRVEFRIVSHSQKVIDEWFKQSK